MIDFLSEIGRRAQERVEELKRAVPVARFRGAHSRRILAPRFRSALCVPGRVTVIAELKQASPSAGMIRQESDLAGRIDAYARGGAAALSILTESDYFHGSPEILKLARQRTDLPLLRKDFIVDAYQLEESVSLGADAVLLIVALLSDSRLEEFIKIAGSLGLDALVEVHNEEEAERALKIDAPLIGVNNRDLRSLQVDLRTSERLVPHLVREHRTVIVESGIKDPAQLKSIGAWGAKAVLVGEALMRQEDAESAVRSFVQGGEH
jgi:indole-3-glycerol phosphate synthase